MQYLIFVVLVFLYGETVYADETVDVIAIANEVEEILTCQKFPENRYGDASLQLNLLVESGAVTPVKQNPKYHFRVVDNELSLFGIKPIYLGHVHGDFIGTFARFAEDISVVADAIKAKGVILDKQQSSAEASVYLGKQLSRWRLIVLTIPAKFADGCNPSVPYSAEASTLVQCVYQGP